MLWVTGPTGGCFCIGTKMVVPARTPAGAFHFFAATVLASLTVASFCDASDIPLQQENLQLRPPLRIVVKTVEPFVYIPADGPPHGFSIDLWNLISKNMGRPCEYSRVKTVDEMITAITLGQADVAVGALTITAEREKVIDFCHAFFRSGLRIASPVASGFNSWHALNRFLAFDLIGLAVALGSLTVFTANLLWLVERRQNPESFPRAYFRGVGEAIWWSVSTVITGGCENKTPVTVLGRLIAVIWMLGGIVLIATFTATLASRMTAESISSAVNGPEDLPGRRIATIANTAVVADMQERLASVVPCDDMSSAVVAVREGRADVVVYDSPILAHFVERNPECAMCLVGPLFEHQYYGFAVPTDSPLREDINRALLAIDESGDLAALNQKWFGERE